MKKETFGFAILGSGVIARKHAQQIKQVARARLVAVQHPDAEKAAAFAHEFGCRFFARVDDLLACDDVDIVTICTPTGMHAEQAIACAKAGKHVISEKAMDVTLAKADAMIAAFDAAGLYLGVIFQHRFDDAVRRVKSHLDAGSFGKLVMGTAAIFMFRPQSYYDSSAWRGTWEWDGGGVLMNQGIHTIDLLQHLMGPVESVEAICATSGHVRIEVEDNAVATLRFRNGALGTVVASTCASFTNRTRIEIFGTEGSAVIENDQLRFCTYRAGPGATAQIDDLAGVFPSMATSGLSEEGFARQFADMIEAIDCGRTPVVDGHEGRKSLELVLAIYESARTGLRVRVGR